MDYDVYLISNGRYWLARWDAGGKTCARSLGSKAKLSERQARARCRQLSVDLRLNLVRDGTAPRLSEWIEKYSLLRTDIAPQTRLLIELTGRYLMAFFTNDPPIDRITRADAAEFRAALATGQLTAAKRYPKPDEAVKPNTRHHAYRKALSVRARRAMAPSTVAKHVRCAKRMFGEATDDGVGIIQSNPFRRLSGRAPEPVKDWKDVSHADLRRILDACPSDGWRALFALCRFAGLRRQEALDLEWTDLVWDGNRLSVNSHIDHVSTKRRPRVCPIEPARCPTGLTELLEGYLSEAAEGAVKVCEVSIHNIDRLARRIIKAAGLVPYRKPFHTLRKNRAEELAAEYPQHVVTEWLGHDGDVARRFYLRVDDSLYEPARHRSPRPQQARVR